MATEQQSETPSSSPQTPSLDQFLTEGVRFFKQRHELQRKEQVWNNIKKATWVVLVGGLILFQLTVFANAFGVRTGPAGASVAMIPVHGPISAQSQASADKVVPLIEKACENEGIEQIILEINSPGGSPNESERIVSAIEACRAEHGVHFISLIDGMGASAAYMIAMHADEVIAGRYTVVGSIGAIMRYVDASSLAGKLGLKERIYKSGLVKGGPSMLSGSDEDMDRLNQEMVATLGHDFVDELFAQRKHKIQITREEIATGRIWTAPRALEIGLIDRVATLEQLKASDFKDVRIYEYQPQTAFAEGFGLKHAVAGTLKTMLLELEAPTVQ